MSFIWKNTARADKNLNKCCQITPCNQCNLELEKRLSEEAHDAHCTLSANFTILTREGVDAGDSSGQMTTQVEERLDGKLSKADACCYSRPTSSRHVM